METPPARRRTGRGLALLLWAGLAGCEPSPPAGADATAVNPTLAVGTGSLHAEGVRSYLADALGFTSRGGRVFCSYSVLGRGSGRVYLWSLCEELVPAADSLESGSGVAGPVALVLDTLARPVRIAGHRVPRDGGLHARDVAEIFPAAVRRRLSAGRDEHDRRAEALRRANREAAAASYGGRPETGG